MTYTDKRATAPKSEARVILVLELELQKSSTPQWVRVTESLPSRPGAFTKVWPIRGGLIDNRDAEDMAAFVTKATIDGILSAGGIQMSL